jgi:hypothetical protein
MICSFFFFLIFPLAVLSSSFIHALSAFPLCNSQHQLHPRACQGQLVLYSSHLSHIHYNKEQDICGFHKSFLQPYWADLSRICGPVTEARGYSVKIGLEF